jgi:O-antigen/teichoic acid export membrane protein
VISLIKARVSDFQAAFLPQGSLRARFVMGTLWVLFGTLVSQGLQLAGTVFVARWIGRSEYGALGIVKSTVGMFGVFVGLGLGLTATKHVSELRQDNPSRAGRIAALTLIVAAVSGSVFALTLVLLSPWLAVHTLASPGVATPLAIGAGLLIFGELNGVQTGILSGLEAFAAIARVSLWAGLCTLPIIVTTTWFWGLRGAVLGLVLSVAVNCILSNAALRREANRSGVVISFSGSWIERAVLWKFSAPAFLGSVVVTPTAWICNTMLVNRPNGYAEMGLFSAADQWRNIILFLPGIISRVLLPILSSHSNESAREASRFSNTLTAGFSVTVAVAFPLVTLFNFANSLIVVAYGKGFAAMFWPLAGLSYAGGLLAIGTPVGLAVQAKGAMWSGFVSNLYWAVLLLGFFRFFFVHGAWGLANAWASSYFLVTASALWFFCKAGYYPWRLGIRTNLACIALLPFAFGPLCLSPALSLRLCPVALVLAMITAWLLVPSEAARALLPGRWLSSWGRRA